MPTSGGWCGSARAGTPLSLAPAAVPAPAGWQLVDPNHGRNVTAAYAELEWE